MNIFSLTETISSPDDLKDILTEEKQDTPENFDVLVQTLQLLYRQPEYTQETDLKENLPEVNTKALSSEKKEISTLDEKQALSALSKEIFTLEENQALNALSKEIQKTLQKKDNGKSDSEKQPSETFLKSHLKNFLDPFFKQPELSTGGEQEEQREYIQEQDFKSDLTSKDTAFIEEKGGKEPITLTEDFIDMKNTVIKKPAIPKAVLKAETEEKNKNIPIEFNAIKKEKNHQMHEEKEETLNASQGKPEISAFPMKQDLLLSKTGAAQKITPMPIKQLMQELPLYALKGQKQVRLQLNPSHLGAVDVQIKQNGNQIELVFSTERKETQDLLQKNMQTLKENFSAKEMVLSHSQFTDPMTKAFSQPESMPFQEKQQRQQPDWEDNLKEMANTKRIAKPVFSTRETRTQGLNLIA
jgi:flagellar hook-length control protein FliK